MTLRFVMVKQGLEELVRGSLKGFKEAVGEGLRETEQNVIKPEGMKILVR